MSKENKIEIEVPIVNPDDHDVVTYSINSEIRDLLNTTFENEEITHLKYPKLVDLGSGNGSIAKLLYDKEWRNPTCIDQHKPAAPLLDETKAHWMFWNLQNLSSYLSDPEASPLPEPIEQYRGKYDLVTAGQVPINKDQFEKLVRFFLLDTHSQDKNVRIILEGDVWVAVREK